MILSNNKEIYETNKQYYMLSYNFFALIVYVSILHIQIDFSDLQDVYYNINYLYEKLS